MKNLLILLTILPFLAFSQETNDCDEKTMPTGQIILIAELKEKTPGKNIFPACRQAGFAQ
ncbi:hypothetical protein [Maribacter spongiicola]|uniref:hypothetical protein n=1 Tax=Maribacter spongiicola TaxID=1206753 RepID=UPI00105EB106|nr:hypothetical protein [Maribacter spongiicola]